MISWHPKPLEMVADVVGGGTPERDNASYWGPGHYWVTLTDLPPPGSTIGAISHTNEMITDEGLKSSAATILPPNSVLFSSRATIGKVAINMVPVATNQGFASFIPNPEMIRARFLAYTLLHRFRDLEQLSGSTTFKEVTRGNLRRFEIMVPADLHEQDRIVDLLDQLDALRRQRAEADAKLARLLPALFRHHFGDPVSNERQWPTEALTRICEPRQWPTISQKDLTESGFTVYGANGPIGFYTEYNHEDPTVLITCRGATCGTINVSPPKCYVTGNAMSLDNPDPTRTTNEFLEVFLRTRGLSDTITGAAQPQITRANLAVVQIFTPPMPLVKRFSVQVRETQQVLARAAASAAKLDTLFQTLLYRAFTGELTAKWREAHIREGVQEMSNVARS